MTTELQTSRHGATLVLTLHGPANRNALSPQVYAAGVETLSMAEDSPEVSSVVITGSGGHFCSGGDLMRLAHNREHDLPAQAAAIEAFHHWIEALQAFPKPVLAAVEGRAAGGGVSLALACDLLVAAEDARFTMAYSQIGLSPDGGASWQLARRAGHGRALAWLWSGDTQSAQEWAAAGLVHRLAPSGTALNTALAWAEQLNMAPSAVLASIKALVRSADSRPLHDQLQAEQAHFLRNLAAPAAGKAIKDFLQRRKG
ncbi:MAG: oxepin-CoA hydrolase, alternative type [Aquabacterium sp.]